MQRSTSASTREGETDALDHGDARPDPALSDSPSDGWARPRDTPTAASDSPIAGVKIRLAAYFVDNALLLPVTYGLSALITGPHDLGKAEPLRQTLAQLLILVVNGAYYIGFWLSGQATLGMRLTGLRITSRATGETLSRSSAVERWLALEGVGRAVILLPAAAAATLVSLANAIWWLVLIVSTARDPMRQGIHDRWAGSVVRAGTKGGRFGLSAGVWLLGSIAMLAISSAIVDALFLHSAMATIVGQLLDLLSGHRR